MVRGTDAPCSQCAISRCPAQEEYASSANAVLLQTRVNDSAACTAQMAVSGCRKSRQGCR